MKTLQTSSERERPRALIFGMWHHLLELFKDCSNYGPRVKIGLSPGARSVTYAYIVKKIFFFETERPRALAPC